eukprot:NODE_138_length_16264_cov_1.140860.p8 type:complete len:350 gc:universal NODE_138_length_16264_cov_1.140860:6408-5359(-)
MLIILKIPCYNMLRIFQKRCLNLHEYQSMQILKNFNVAIPNGKVASTPDEAAQVSKQFPSAVIKAQVLAGGRGKGHFDSGLQGGVQLTSNSSQIKEYAQQMLGHKLITKQTGAQGKPCNKVFIVEKLKLKKEYYFAILNDRKHQGPVLIASSEGGMDIEHVAATNPKAIVTQPIDIHKGLTDSVARDVATKIGFSGQAIDEAADIFQKLYKVFTEKDCTLVEINPLAELNSGKVLCMDAKLGFDDNADFRQKDVFTQRDYSQEDKREVDASKFQLNYIGLDGNVGCLVNGAGLAMATMDVLKLNGGDPANFLDVGGSATTTQVTAAFKIISSDERVSAIFVNIFGGFAY